MDPSPNPNPNPGDGDGAAEEEGEGALLLLSGQAVRRPGCAGDAEAEGDDEDERKVAVRQPRRAAPCRAGRPYVLHMTAMGRAVATGRGGVGERRWPGGECARE